MNIWLKLLIGIGGFILLTILLRLIREMIYLIRESHSIRMFDSRSNRLELLSGIYMYASNTYVQFAEKGIVLADYAYLAEVSIYGMIKILGGDASALLQKIQKYMDKPKDPQGGGRSIGITPRPKGPKPVKLNMSDKEINDILNKWEKEHPGWRDKGKKDGNGLSK